jgi:hypothetical protein
MTGWYPYKQRCGPFTEGWEQCHGLRWPWSSYEFSGLVVFTMLKAILCSVRFGFRALRTSSYRIEGSGFVVGCVTVTRRAKVGKANRDTLAAQSLSNAFSCSLCQSIPRQRHQPRTIPHGTIRMSPTGRGPGLLAFFVQGLLQPLRSLNC